MDAYGKYFCENDSNLTLTFKGNKAILQAPDDERTWTMEQVDAQNWRLTQVSDTIGNSIHLNYDNDGNIVFTFFPDGQAAARELTFTVCGRNFALQIDRITANPVILELLD